MPGQDPPSTLCPCGSGQQYAACHGASGLPLNAFRQLRREAERQRLRERGLRIDFVTPVLFDGQRVWGLGSRIYPGRPNETFHEFIIRVLIGELGREWWDHEKQASDKHYVMSCIEAHGELTIRAATPENRQPDGRWAAEVEGPSQYLLALAFDVVSLIHKHKLPDALLTRLRNKQQFQGARYEIAVAAIFARLGYDIEWREGVVAPNMTHCEFYATHPSNGLSIAVEAKSRHRPGVLHTAGVQNEAGLMRGDVGRLIKEAEDQAPGDRPFLIFVDLNAPVTHVAVIDSTWRPEIMEGLQARYVTAGSPMPIFSAVYVTNFSYHYDIGRTSGKNEILEIISNAPAHSVADATVFAQLKNALRFYGEVPDIDIEDLE